MSLFSKRKTPSNLLNPFIVAEGFGNLVLEQLAHEESQCRNSVEEIRSTWAPIMAAITRAAEREGFHKPILERFRAGAKPDAVRFAVEQEIDSRNEALYDPIFRNQSEFQSVANQILSQCYEGALRQGQRTGTMDSSNTAKFAELVLTAYISEKKKELDNSDKFFVKTISQATARSVEQLWEKMLEYGIDNSQIFMKINSTVIATATVLRYAK